MSLNKTSKSYVYLKDGRKIELDICYEFSDAIFFKIKGRKKESYYDRGTNEWRDHNDKIVTHYSHIEKHTIYGQKN